MDAEDDAAEELRQRLLALSSHDQFGSQLADILCMWGEAKEVAVVQKLTTKIRSMDPRRVYTQILCFALYGLMSTREVIAAREESP
jgi:hypothetical protein